MAGELIASIFGTDKFMKDQNIEKKEDIYSNIDDMLNRSLKSEEGVKEFFNKLKKLYIN
jgi:hypothetical protein